VRNWSVSSIAVMAAILKGRVKGPAANIIVYDRSD
jgi:hypothetical protein